jgi:hypothetical protein
MILGKLNMIKSLDIIIDGKDTIQTFMYLHKLLWKLLYNYNKS